MPHIKILPFNRDKLEKLDYVDFRAVSDSGSEIFRVNFENNKAIFEIKTSKKFNLIKPSKVTRSLNVEWIKRVLSRLKDDLSLEVISSNIELHPQKPKIATKFHKTIKDFMELNFFSEGFKNISLEIGFGSGKHLLFRAKNSPETLFIGVEIHTQSAQQVLKQIRLQNIENIYIINYDARLLLEILPSNILTKIYLHFPIPWDKKPHRRVMNREFVDEVIRTLKVGGEFELRSDSFNYYLYSLDILNSLKSVKFVVEKNKNLEVTSKYESRWLREGKDIYNVTLINEKLSEDKDKNYSFSFDEVENFDSMNTNLGKIDKIVTKNYFISIQKTYKLTSRDGVVLELSFGNFNRPEHKYLLIKKDLVEYIPDAPIPTKDNFDAHKRLRRIVWQMQ